MGLKNLITAFTSFLGILIIVSSAFADPPPPGGYLPRVDSSKYVGREIASEPDGMPIKLKQNPNTPKKPVQAHQPVAPKTRVEKAEQRNIAAEYFKKKYQTGDGKAKRRGPAPASVGKAKKLKTKSKKKSAKKKKPVAKKKKKNKKY